MYKQCKILNKNTNEILQGQIDTELENVAGYPYREATQEEIDRNEQEKKLLKKEEQKKQLVEQGVAAFIPVLKVIVKDSALMQDVKAKVPAQNLQQLETVIDEIEKLEK